MKAMITCVICLTLLACKNESKQQETIDYASILKSPNYSAEKCFRSNVVIILAEELTDKSKKIVVQEYKSENGDFIPVFTSMEKFKESTKNTDIGKPVIEINGFYLLSLLDGTEILRVNPELSDEITFNASQIVPQFKAEIDSVKKKLDQ